MERLVDSQPEDAADKLGEPSLLLEETRSVRLGEAAALAESLSRVDIEPASFSVWRDARLAKLVDALAGGKIIEINPIIDVSLACGFAYPEVDRLTEASGDESRALLELLANENILSRKPFERIHADPDGSFLLVFVERCPRCGSGNMIKGQLIEHFSCGNTGMEQDYSRDEHKYICPKCNKELRLLGTDYRKAGTRYRCLDCKEIFPTPVIKWRNLVTGKIWDYEGLHEVTLYAYVLSPDKKDWLEFQLKPKARLVDFLQYRGYQVEELAKVSGGSGAMHTIDILATRDDGLVKYNMGIGILIALRSQGEVGLVELFTFDTKAYDMGLNYKVVIAVPKLSKEAAKFAERQKIGVFEVSEPSELIEFLNVQRTLAPGLPMHAHSLHDQTNASVVPQAQIAAFLKNHGYEVYQNALVSGRSGAKYTFNILAQRDDVIVRPAIAVGIVVTDAELVVGIDKVSQFDAEAFDSGIRNKVFVGIPQVSPEAKRFAKQQRIKVLEESDLRSLLQSGTVT